MTIVKYAAFITASVFFVFFCSGNDAFAQYYRYVDSAGVVHLTNDYQSESCKTYGCTLVILSPEDAGDTVVDKGKHDVLRNEKSSAPKEVAVAPDTSVVIPSGQNLPDAEGKSAETKSIDAEIENLVSQWLNSWKSGDMKTYRTCYATNFRSKEMNLDAWIAYKSNVYKRSKNINISIDNLQIKTETNVATVRFTQHYTSSRLKDSGRKKLELRKINNEWKIYREIM